jgi:ABC-type methionine transport system permease subunit
MKDTMTCLLFALLLAFAIGIPAGVWIFKSSMEARAFNNVTGKNVSTWDAMWIELRVQEQSQEGKAK